MATTALRNSRLAPKRTERMNLEVSRHRKKKKTEKKKYIRLKKTPKYYMKVNLQTLYKSVKEAE